MAQVNRYNTPVSVEVWNSERITRIKWFGDYQEAYLWVLAHVEQCSLNDPPIILPFEEGADRLEDRWKIKKDGITLARTSSYKFRAYYEPTERHAMNLYRYMTSSGFVM